MAHDLDPRFLRAFVAVAERGSFSGAAAALHLTQPALSRRIGELEAALGVRVFDRTSRRVEITAAGEDLLARCQDMLKAGEALQERSRALAQGKAGILRVGCAPMIMESVVAPALAQYHRRFPEVELQLREYGGRQAVDAVLAGELHAAVASPEERGLHTELLFPWRLLAVVPARHPLARARTVVLSQIAGLPLLTLPQGFGSRALFDAACETAGIHPDIRMEATSAHTLVTAAREGYGVAVVPSVLLMDKRHVKVLPLLSEGKSLGRWLAVQWDPRRPAPAYLSGFSALLAARLNAAYPGREYRFAPPIKAPAPRTGRRARATSR